jgi:hypothetical protein
VIYTQLGGHFGLVDSGESVNLDNH